IVTINCSGSYSVSGTTSNGQIIVETASTDTGNVYLYLKGITMTNTSDAPIYVKNAEKTFLVMESGTTNTFTDASTRASGTDTAGACIYSKDDLTLKGTGTLKVYGKYNNGIHTTNDLRVRETPTIIVEAVNNALKGKEMVDIENGTFNLTTTSGDGIKVDSTDDTSKDSIYITAGTFTIKAGADGIQAYNSVRILGGTFTITTGTGVANTTKTESQGNVSTSTEDDSSLKGIKAGSNVTISGGTFTIHTEEDAIHSNHVVNINNGSFSIIGRRGAHADDTLNVNGGTFVVTNSYEGLEAYVINMNGGVSAIYATDDGWNASNGSSAGTINVTGGYHYVKTGSGDTDGIDSNGDINLKGGVLVIEAGGNIIDKGDNNNTVNYTGGILLGFGSQVEGTPSSGNPVCYSGTVNSGSRFSIAPSSTVLSTYTMTQSASKVIYINSANTGSSGYTGGTYTAGTETKFGSYGTYGEGGTISGGTSVTMSTCTTSGPGGGW
ncbi:MAG: carbohydrate-binding domain-containing protein, partial [Fibrobacteraceae bacterium]